MALVFPLSLEAFADKLRMVSAPFILEEQQELSGLGGGEILAAGLAPDRWTTPVTLKPMIHTQAREIQALIESLRGALQTFYLYSPTNCYPAFDPGGIILGSASPVVHTIGSNNKSLRINGLPSGYRLSAGDLLAFDYGVNPTRRALHRVVEAVVASGAGLTPAFEIVPPLRPGLVTGAAVALKKPAAKMVRVPKSLSVSHAGRFSTISFQAIQTFR